MCCLGRPINDDSGILQIRQSVQLLAGQKRRLCRLQGESGRPLWKTASESPRACQQWCLTSSRWTWCMCAGQSQDGNGVSSGSGFELSELMKRRLESVASTGSSVSSGFIEDKSYCDSEEEEEGKGQAKHVLLPLDAHTSPPHSSPPLCLSLLLSPPSHLCSTPPEQERTPPTPSIRLFSSLRLIGRFLLLFRSTITTAGATVTPLSLERQLFISCPDPTVALFFSSGTSVMSMLLMCYFWFEPLFAQVDQWKNSLWVPLWSACWASPDVENKRGIAICFYLFKGCFRDTFM